MASSGKWLNYFTKFNRIHTNHNSKSIKSNFFRENPSKTFIKISEKPPIHKVPLLRPLDIHDLIRNIDRNNKSWYDQVIIGRDYNNLSCSSANAKSPTPSSGGDCEDGKCKKLKPFTCGDECQNSTKSASKCPSEDKCKKKKKKDPCAKPKCPKKKPKCPKKKPKCPEKKPKCPKKKPKCPEKKPKCPPKKPKCPKKPDPCGSPCPKEEDPCAKPCKKDKKPKCPKEKKKDKCPKKCAATTMEKGDQDNCGAKQTDEWNRIFTRNNNDTTNNGCSTIHFSSHNDDEIVDAPAGNCPVTQNCHESKKDCSRNECHVTESCGKGRPKCVSSCPETSPCDLALKDCEDCPPASPDKTKKMTSLSACQVCDPKIYQTDNCEDLDEYFGDCYKAKDYFMYRDGSYYDLMVNMASDRCPQPNPRVGKTTDSKICSECGQKKQE